MKQRIIDSCLIVAIIGIVVAIVWWAMDARVQRGLLRDRIEQLERRQ